MTQTTVRYFVTDVDEAIDFYCNRLGFHVDLPLAPGFAGLAKDDLRLLLHEPGVGGAGKAGGVPTPEGGIGSRSSLPISTRPLSASLLRGRRSW
jgi:catechol 2,3-dioxygenase-like lactoylglutathione lyase family enzyme